MDIDNGLENLFGFESLEIKLEEDIPNTVDQWQVKIFIQNIEFKNNHYYGGLPWFEGKAELVPSDLNFSFKIAQKVFYQLTQNNFPDK